MLIKRQILGPHFKSFGWKIRESACLISSQCENLIWETQSHERKKPPLNKKSVTKGNTEASWKRKILILTINFDMIVSKQGGINNAWRSRPKLTWTYTYLNYKCLSKSYSRAKGRDCGKGTLKKLTRISEAKKTVLLQ